METEEKRNGQESDLCIVLRAIPYGEADLILTLFSREHGRIDARAYGARSLKSKYRAACQPFCLAEFEFYLKNDRRSVKSADVRSSFSGLQTDYCRYLAGCTILELAEKSLQGAGPEEREQLFVLLVHTLSALQSFEGQTDYLLLFFYVRAVQLMGVFPSLHACVHCGAPVGDSVRWSAADGGCVCSRCAEKTSTSELSPAVLQCLRSFGRSRPASERDLSFDLPAVDESIRAMEDVLRCQLDILSRVRSRSRR